MGGGVPERPASSRNRTQKAGAGDKGQSVFSKWEGKQEEKKVPEEVSVMVSLLGHRARWRQGWGGLDHEAYRSTRDQNMRS